MRRQLCAALVLLAGAQAGGASRAAGPSAAAAQLMFTNLQDLKWDKVIPGL